MIVLVTGQHESGSSIEGCTQFSRGVLTLSLLKVVLVQQH